MALRYFDNFNFEMIYIFLKLVCAYHSIRLCYCESFSWNMLTDVIMKVLTALCEYFFTRIRTLYITSTLRLVYHTGGWAASENHA